VDIGAIRTHIKGNLGRQIIFYDTVGSTNTVALGLDEGTPEGTVIISDFQERGRGRLNRSWVSPPGINIYLSILLRPKIEPEHATLITLLSAIACTYALRKTTSLSVSVKWPNDLMAADRKLGGILTEMKITGKRIVIAVIGIGINVNMEPADFPDHLRRTATSVKIETGKHFTREQIVSEVLNETDRWYKVLQAGRSKEIIDEWQHLTSTLGRQVLVATGQGTYAGVAEGIDEGGMLLVRLTSGELKRISSGDLTTLK
jgi:BirA family biotin operon repressor/biotin-[acetyl-CoA-carboxylase] ligase